MDTIALVLRIYSAGREWRLPLNAPRDLDGSYMVRTSGEITVANLRAVIIHKDEISLGIKKGRVARVEDYDEEERTGNVLGMISKDSDLNQQERRSIEGIRVFSLYQNVFWIKGDKLSCTGTYKNFNTPPTSS